MKKRKVHKDIRYTEYNKKYEVRLALLQNRGCHGNSQRNEWRPGSVQNVFTRSCWTRMTMAVAAMLVFLTKEVHTKEVKFVFPKFT